MTPEQLIDKWKDTELAEPAAAQEHFLDLCALLGVETPAAADKRGELFTFQKSLRKPDGSQGWADVWKKRCFAWEYKRPGRSLVKAYTQLKEYADALENPPLLIVSDIQRIEIHTNFTNMVAETHVIGLPDLRSPEAVRLLRRAFKSPDELKPTRSREAVTAEAAQAFAIIARKLRGRGHEPRRVAHFLNKLVFCMFVEDIELLPDRVFAEIIEVAREPADFTDMLGDLFRAMRSDGGRFGTTRVPWFNGGLFDDDDVPPLNFLEIKDLAVAARLDWAAIEPSIFGTLFERGLDPERRKEMASLFDGDVPDAVALATPSLFASSSEDRGVGIHYTDRDTIMKLIEPVVLRPLRAEWEQVKAELAALRGKKREARYTAFRERLGAVRVLDPACGSGNFLYLALLHLKDLDLAVSREAAALGLPPDAQRIGPDNVLGIEINPYAAELARVTIWIGEIQWQVRNGFRVERRPILGSLGGIACRDALLGSGSWEASWPESESIVGNPPFLGNKRMLGALGESYVARLREAFKDRVPGGADLVTYWFEKARAMIEGGRTKRAGLVATNSIRGGANRKVLERIKQTGAIFEAWSDEPWVIDGAAVRVSLVGFAGKGNAGPGAKIDGAVVSEIFADLTGGARHADRGTDVTAAKPLRENQDRAFQGPVKVGPFDIPGDLARNFLCAPVNPNGRSNTDVVRPWANGADVVRRPSDTWIIDFGERTESEAALYEGPFEHVRRHVKPMRDTNRRDRRRTRWWQHGETVPGLRSALSGLSRFMVTPRVAKHRIFVWVSNTVLPDSRLYAIARDDDMMFGVLHSKLHEMWTLATCSWHGVGNDPTYNAESCFETFPFPEGLTPNIPAKDCVSDPRAQVIAAAARRLNELREAWLNPPDLVKREPEVVPGFPDRLLPRGPKAEASLRKRTLTNLYNARPQWLTDAHRALDEAVAAAYGWPADIADDDALARLLALNLARAKAQAMSDTESG